MANKALSKRQKLMIHTQPDEVPGTRKPRNPFVAPGKQRSAGAHRRCVNGERQLLNRLLEKALKDPQN